MKINRKWAAKVSIIIGLIIILRTCYYGSPFRSCIYTEEELKPSQSIAKSTIRFFRPAAVVRGVDNEYRCLEQMGRITNQIVDSKMAQYYRFKGQDFKVDYVDSSARIELQPIKLISVTKHGVTTIDSGSGPIIHLILRDRAGNIYQVATVGLGINKGDQYLEAISDGAETVLTPDSRFTD